MASLYRRGQVWWSKSYEAGKMVRTSLGTRDKAEARRRLREREAQVIRGERPPASKVTWDTTAADLVAYYLAYGSRNVREAEGRLKQLTRYFGGMKLVEIDAAAILGGYVAHRRRQGELPRLSMLTWAPFGRRYVSLRSTESWLRCQRSKCEGVTPYVKASWSVTNLRL
jgi:hypothetical protein